MIMITKFGPSDGIEIPFAHLDIIREEIETSNKKSKTQLSGNRLYTRPVLPVLQI